MYNNEDEQRCSINSAMANNCNNSIKRIRQITANVSQITNKIDNKLNTYKKTQTPIHQRYEMLRLQ